MTEKYKRLIHLVYGIVLSVLITVVAVCLIVSCVDIYNSGDRPFTRDSIGSHFQGIAIPVYACLGVILGGFFLQLFLPLEEKKQVHITNEQRLERMQKRFDVQTIDETTAQKIRFEQRLRKWVTFAAVVLCALCALPALIYLFNGNNFTVEELNADIFKAMGVVMITSVAMLAVGIVRMIVASLSVSRELELIKSLGKQGAKEGEVTAVQPQAKGMTVVRIALLAIAIALVVIGILNGGMADVLAKAVRICTECIGLG